MASSARRIVIEFLGDDKSASSTARRLDGSTSKLGDTFKRVGKYAALGLAAGIAGAAVAMVSMVKNAAADEAAQRKLATAMRNSVGATDAQIASVEDYISSVGVATGVTDDEMRPALQRLIESTGSVEEAQRQMSIAMDVSAGTGKSLEVVSAALMKANNGTTASLSKLGLKTKDAEGNTLSMRDALKSMADTFEGQAAAKADSLEGKMARLSLIIDETKENIGAKLIPVVSDLADKIITDVIPAMQDAARWFGENIQPKLEDLGRVIKRVFDDAAKWVRDNMDEIKSTIAGIVQIATALWDRFGGTLTAMTKNAWDNVKNTLKGAFKIISGLVKAWSAVFRGDWKEVWEGVKQAWSGVWIIVKSILSNALKNIGLLLRAAVGLWWDLFKATWGRILIGARDAMGNLVDIVASIPDKLGNLAWKFLNAGKNLIGAVFDGIKDAAGDVGGFVSNLASQLTDAIKGAINDALDLPLDIDFDKGPIHIHATVIPAFAKGGVTKGGLVLVGEKGPELADLPGGTRVHTSARTQRMMGDSGGGITVNVYGALDPNAVAQQIEQMLARRKRLNGNQPLAFA